MQAAPVSTFKVASITSLGLVAAAVSPFVPFLGVPAAAFALGWLAASGFAPLAIVTALLGAGVAAVGEPWTAVFTVPALLLAGPGAVWGVRRWPAVNVMVVLAFVLCAASLASDALTLSAHGTSLVALARQSVEEAARVASATVAQSEGAAAAASMKVQLAAWSQMALLMLPSVYFMMGAITAVFAVLAASRAAVSRGVEVLEAPRLADLDLSVHFVWPVALGVLLLAAAPFVDGESRIALAIGANLLIGVRIAFLAQGMGVGTALMRRMGFGLPGRVVGSAVLLAVDVLTYSVTAVGLADMWLNFRRLPRESGQPGGTEESGPAS